MTRLTSGRDLGRVLNEVINTTLGDRRNITEAEQLLTDEGGDIGDDEKTLESGDVSTSDVIDKLNSIRAGKSFKDSAIKGSLEGYVDKLDKAQKTALFAFLKGVAQIVTGEIPAQTAMTPSNPEPDVKMKKFFHRQTGTKTVTVKPTIVKKPVAGGGIQKKSVEDTSSPVPITPKK